VWEARAAEVLSRVAMQASSAARRESRIVRDRQIIAPVAARVVRNALSEPKGRRSETLGNVWTALKLFGASNVRNVPLSRIRGIHAVRVDGPVLHHDALVVSALAALLECERIFAMGTALDETCWLIAHNLSSVRLYHLGRPGVAQQAGIHLIEPAEAIRITRLVGDPDTFDVSAYSGTMDLVHIDAGEGGGDIRAQTDAAFGLLSELGSIVWADYPHSAGVYAYLNELAPALDRPVFHILGTRLALYSRWDIVRPSD
jgi:hypothetical protein